MKRLNAAEVNVNGVALIKLPKGKILGFDVVRDMEGVERNCLMLFCTDRDPILNGRKMYFDVSTGDYITDD